MSDKNKNIDEFCDMYVAGIELEFNERWRKVPVDLSVPYENEVVVGLLRRQSILACRVARNPGIWNPDVGPIVLRSMAEIHIWIAWILQDPAERAMKYIEYGQGQEKLFVKHRKDELERHGVDPDDDPVINASVDWLNSQRYTDQIDVNLSSRWSGSNIRKMAEECGLRDFYRFNYPFLSASTHSMWNHVSKYDLNFENNPLHGYHRVPFVDLHPSNEVFLCLAARYLNDTFILVDTVLDLSIKSESMFDVMFQAATTEEKK